MTRGCSAALLAALVIGPIAAFAQGSPAPANADPRARELAQTVMERMGGARQWDGLHYVHWVFFGKRKLTWDKWTGDLRIETDKNRTVLMNVNTKQGRAWQDGKPLEGEELAKALDMGHQIFINDMYWMFMPYKLLDPGVTLKYAGERAMKDGRAADVLELTFAAGVGYTPQNRYEVFVAKDTGLVEQWSFYEKAGDPEPGFTLPWGGWKKFGGVMLATVHDDKAPWEVAVFDTLPRSVFDSPEPAKLGP